MKKKMLGIFVITLLLIATGITVAGTMELKTDSSKGKEGYEDWGWYNPAGAWKRYDNELFFTVSPAGWGRYGVVCEGASMNATFYGLFPTAVSLNAMYGEMAKSGKNTYDITLMDYAIDENYDVVYFRLWNGALVLSSEDTCECTFTGSIYSPTQDPFVEEDPVYGCWGPWTFTYDRIPVVPPCES